MYIIYLGAINSNPPIFFTVARPNLLLSPTNTLVLVVKDNKSSLHGNVSKEREAANGLDTAKTLLARVVGIAVVDERGGHDNLGVLDTKAEVGNGLGAVVGNGGNVAVVVGAGDLAPVVLDGAVGQQDQAGAGVGNGVNVGVDEAVANTVAGGSEAPVAAGAVERGVDDGVLVLGVVDEAKVVVSV